MSSAAETAILAGEAAGVMPEIPCDVFVIGGGPAGSTIAALLAAKGDDVVIVEKERHPRFHIGESLLPLNVPLFEKLGIREAIDRIGMPKYGVEFVSPYHNKNMFFDFGRAWDKTNPSSYQVRRSEFDEILWKNAAEKGAQVIDACRVGDVTFLDEGGARITARLDSGETRIWRAKFVIDATGRDTFLANRLETKQRNRRHSSAAVFGHFTNARRLSGKEEGHISLFWFDHGWFWFIPLADGTTSVGAVCRPDFIKARKGDVTEFFRQVIAMCPEIESRLTAATLIGKATATGNYSYQSDRMSGRDFILLGDAFAFIDPVFSTGVYLAMSSAFFGAEAVTACLHAPAKAPAALRLFEAQVRSGLGSFSWYIYRINRPAFRDLLMYPRNYFRVEEALLGLLAGDIFRRSGIHLRLELFKLFFHGRRLGRWLEGLTDRRPKRHSQPEANPARSTA